MFCPTGMYWNSISPVRTSLSRSCFEISAQDWMFLSILFLFLSFANILIIVMTGV